MWHRTFLRRFRSAAARCDRHARRRPPNSTRVTPTVESLEARRLLSTTLLLGTWNTGIADAGYYLGSYNTVLAAIGQESHYAPPRPPDILTITETRTNANSGSTADTQFLTQIMNGIYGSGVYGHGTLDGASTGGGTEGVIYDTQTVQLLQEKTVGVASTNGPPRQELRYLFRPLGYPDGSADFYVYVGHYKAGFTVRDKHRRAVEANEVRADADALGAGKHILYTGDFNADSSNEPAEQILLKPGNGQAFDPINRLGQWYNNNAMKDVMTAATAVNAPPGLSGGGLDGRLDLLWQTAALSGGSGLQAEPATYHSLGNNGTVPLGQGVDYPGNTALSELPNQKDVLNALANDSSDHLPVVQTYQVVTPGPAHRVDALAICPPRTFGVVDSANTPAIASVGAPRESEGMPAPSGAGSPSSGSAANGIVAGRGSVGGWDGDTALGAFGDSFLDPVGDVPAR
jgi:hypothetical protein